MRKYQTNLSKFFTKFDEKAFRYNEGQSDKYLIIMAKTNSKEQSEKEALLVSLLKKDRDLSMKDANVVIREKFGVGVAPPLFSKIKRELLDNEETKKKETSAKTIKAKKTTKKTQENKKEVKKAKKEDQIKNIKEDVAENLPPAEPELSKQKYPVKLKVEIENADTVHLSGSFNHWKQEELALKKEKENIWTFDGQLPEGEHSYKYIVNNKEWYLDLNLERVTDKTGVSHPIVIAAPKQK